MNKQRERDYEQLKLELENDIRIEEEKDGNYGLGSFDRNGDLLPAASPR